jgi:hypothetical protein
VALQSLINPGFLAEVQVLERVERVAPNAGRFTPEETLPLFHGTEWAGGWIISRASLEAMTKIKASNNQTPVLGYSSLQSSHPMDMFIQLNACHSRVNVM